MNRYNECGEMDINLLACIFIVFWFPHLMISPGILLEGHQDLTTDCFSCHTPFKGSSSTKCIACHSVAEIGLVTTKGVTIQKEKNVLLFFNLQIEMARRKGEKYIYPGVTPDRKQRLTCTTTADQNSEAKHEKCQARRRK